MPPCNKSVTQKGSPLIHNSIDYQLITSQNQSKINNLASVTFTKNSNINATQTISELKHNKPNVHYEVNILNLLRVIDYFFKGITGKKLQQKMLKTMEYLYKQKLSLFNYRY